MATFSVDQLQDTFPAKEWPHFQAIEECEHEVTLNLDVHKDIRWFTGHFPEQAVLAGVVQTHWAGELGKYLFPLGENFVRLDNLKFQSVILPGQMLQLQMQYDPEKNSLKFKYFSGETTFSEGKFVFEQGAE